jgi:hypothetical protein
VISGDALPEIGPPAETTFPSMSDRRIEREQAPALQRPDQTGATSIAPAPCRFCRGLPRTRSCFARPMAAFAPGFRSAIDSRSTGSLRKLPRMADYAEWSEATSRGLGWGAEAFVSTLQGPPQGSDRGDSTSKRRRGGRIVTLNAERAGKSQPSIGAPRIMSRRGCIGETDQVWRPAVNPNERTSSVENPTFDALCGLVRRPGITR